MHPRQHWQVVRAIGGAHTKGILKTFPRVVNRYTLPYLSMDFNRLERHQMLKGHYDFLNTALDASFFQRVLAGSMTLWQRELDARSFSIEVSGPCLSREGDLTLVFKMDGRWLYRIAFSLIESALLKLETPPGSPASKHLIYVGQVQGCPGDFDRIRQATGTCGDVAPVDMLIAALEGLADALGITIVAGVALENCLSYQKMLKINSTFSYTHFWEKHHGIRTERGHYILPVPLLEKPINLIKANHRKRTLLKRDFKQSIADEVGRVMHPLVLVRCGAGLVSPRLTRCASYLPG
ncbi:MAG: DUF535 family protein [Burkholderiales bacterium]|nr:DUF535 family protein [Burkholderiales bacterium]